MSDVSEEQSVEIFISHKSEDEQIANSLASELQDFGSGRIRCFVSSKLSAGENWFDEIQKHLGKVDLLLLVFTFSDRNWDWPLYEAGMATDLSDPERCRIVCLLPPGKKPPQPIRHLQAVTADEEGLLGFLIDLLIKRKLVPSETPIRGDLEPDSAQLRRAAAELAQYFRVVEPWEDCFTNFLRIQVGSEYFEVAEDIVDEEKGTTVPRILGLKKPRLPEDSLILKSSTAVQLFGLSPEPPGRTNWTWKELCAKANREADADWLEMIGERCMYASRGDRLKSSHCEFDSLDESGLYRPLLHRVSLLANGDMIFEIIFVEQTEEPDP